MKKPPAKPTALLPATPKPAAINYELRGGNGQLFASKDQEVMLSGPAECVHGDTVIEGDGRTIRYLCEHGIAPMVQTLLGPEQATVPFLKGRAEMFEVDLENGCKFKATAKHLVLTRNNFKYVSQLRPGRTLLRVYDFLRKNEWRWNAYSKVKSITSTGKLECFYDLTVPKAAHYFAHGCIHHNTGKTVASVLKLHAICGTVPGAQCAMVRKVQKSLTGSVVKTYLRVVQPERRGIEVYGGKTPQRFIYPNGSQIWLGGMDNASNVLSSERDAIYVNQAEELDVTDWETLLTRATGRGAVVKDAQLYGDCNPGGSMHWIRKRSSLRLLVTSHRDNPSLYTAPVYRKGQDGKLVMVQEGQLTEQGRKSMAALDALTGVRRLRLRDGIWATAEGAVYDEFNPAVHVRERSWLEMQRWYLTHDEGYTNPAVVLLVGEDPDGRHHCFREFYRRGVLQADVVAFAKRWFFDCVGAATGSYDEKADKTRGQWVQGDNGGKLVQAQAVAVDAAAAGVIADMNNAGLSAYPAKGRVLDGINLVQNRLKVQPDGRPRYTVDPSCVEHINEFESLVWKEGKDVPVKEHDHCFIGCTKILTKTGWQRIDTIKPGDFVFSPFGWNKVIDSGPSGMRIVKNYGVLIATPDHKILTTNGLICIDALSYLDKIMVWEQSKSWSFKALFIAAILTPKGEVMSFISKALLVKSLQAAHAACIKRYGNTTTGRFHTARKSITRTATLSITKSIIWCVSLTPSTPNSTNGEFGKATKSTWLKSNPWRPFGTAAKLGTSCTKSLANLRGWIGSCLRSIAKSAAKNIKLPSLQEASSAGLIVKCDASEKEGIRRSSAFHTSPTGQGTLAQTYNLNTEYGCYFANGILVSNSMDAYRYLLDYLAEPSGAFGGGEQLAAPSVRQPDDRPQDMGDIVVKLDGEFFGG